MNKTEFLLKLKLQKGIDYVKLLTVAKQMNSEKTIEVEDLKEMELPEQLMEACLKAFRDKDLDRLVKQIYCQCDVIGFFDEEYPEKLRQIYRPPPCFVCSRRYFTPFKRDRYNCRFTLSN